MEPSNSKEISNSKGNVESYCKNMSSMIKLHKDVISDLRNAVKEIFAIKQLAQISVIMNKFFDKIDVDEMQALKRISEISIDARNAIEKADDVVAEIDRVGTKLLKIMNRGSKDKKRLELAISIYEKEFEGIPELIKDATEKLRIVANDAVKINISVNALKNSIEREEKKLEMQQLSDCANTRGDNYLGVTSATAVAIAGVKYAVAPFIPIIDFISTLLLTAGSSLASLSVAAVITEGFTIKQVKEQYKKALKSLESIKIRYEKMGKNTTEIIEQVDAQRKKLKEIGRLLKTSSGSERDALQEENYFLEFYDDLKEELEAFQQACKEYKE